VTATNDEIRLAIAKAMNREVEIRLCDFDPEYAGAQELEGHLEREIKHGRCAPRDTHTPLYNREFLWPCFVEDRELQIYYPVPNWPEDIGAAWELIEEMGENWTITVENIPDRPKEVLARIFRAHSNVHFMASADTAPRAICLAWLAWKEINS
jgi:hypothetical protein